MNEQLQAFGRDLLPLLALGVLLLLAARAAGWLLDVVPMPRSRRELLGRVRPLLGAALIVAYLLVAARTLFGARPELLPLALTLVAAGLAAAAWPAIRDFASGVIIKTGRVCSVGDLVRVDGMEGRIQRMGYRVMVVEFSQGDQGIIPYSRLVRESIWRSAVRDSVSSHVFRTPLSGKLSLAEAKVLVRQAALLSHWSSIVRAPEVSVVEPGMLEITVFALHPDYAPEIENAVRRALTPGSTLYPQPSAAPRPPLQQ